MKRIFIIGVALLATTLFAGCDALIGFLAKDLEEEDFIIGKLYEDEYVAETPVAVKVETSHRGGSGSTTTNPLGLTYSPDDNAKLYSAIASWIGVPYKYGGTTRDGIDCSSFVGQIYREVYGITLHRTANDMQQDVTLITRDKLHEGDLLFFTNSNGKVSHVGIYLKDGLFSHSSTSNGVCLSRLDNAYWSRHFYRGGRHKKVSR
ncbi:MAG: C40 family peptidase [Bacteroidales bacterium]|nr:C40 family peptidase [Bacteroidales bacterium]